MTSPLPIMPFAHFDTSGSSLNSILRADRILRVQFGLRYEVHRR